MSNTTPCGLDGNIGFPYSFNGELINVNLSKIQTKINFSFGDMKTTPTFMRETGSVNVNSSNTIIYNKTKYDLVYTQICQPHSLWSLKDKNIVAEIIFTFATKDKSSTDPSLVCLSYLIEKTPKDGNNEFLNSMFSIIPPKKNINIMDLCVASPQHYIFISCIPYLEKGKNIGGLRSVCIVGERTLKVGAERLKQLNLAKYKLPSTLLFTNDRQTIINYSIHSGGMANPQTSPTGETFINSINVNDASFQTRFMMFEFIKYAPKKSKSTRIEGFLDQGNAQTQQGGTGQETQDGSGKSDKVIKLDELKCYPINQHRDINKNILLIDPTTGKRMDNYLQDAAKNADPNALTTPEKPKVPLFAIILGIIGGLLVAIIIIAIILFYVKKQPSVKNVVNAAAGAVATAAGSVATAATGPTAAATNVLKEAVKSDPKLLPVIGALGLIASDATSK
jgi:hypothetical protein